MQASNKGDASQVYEGASRATKTSLKDTFKYIIKPLTIFSYRYFVEGIKAVQNDGPTKELEKITNLSYDETIKLMEKCQKDGVRVVATERKLSADENEFGKKKSLYQQQKITKYSRRIKQMSNFKANYPRLSKIFGINRVIKNNERKQNNQIELHKNKYYNIYFNKSKMPYMSERISDLIEYRTGISERLFDKEVHEAVEEMNTKEGIQLNSEDLRRLSEEFKIHEMGNVNTSDFKKDYCVHEIPFSYYMSIKDELEISNIQYGVNVNTNNDNEKIAYIHFENKNLERYNELGFNDIGQVYVYGNDNKNMEWSINSQDEVISFKTKTGEEEKHTYSTLSGKNYIMKRKENECIWTVFKSDLKELAEKEKKRDVVAEDLEKLQIFENLEKDIQDSAEISDNLQNIELDFEKEVGDD